MTTREATAEEWRKLYEAAAAFRKLEPWGWLNDDDLFAVARLDAAKGEAEIAYCCVLGSVDEGFGLAAYLGSQGLDVYERMRARETGSETLMDLVRVQCNLLLTFEDREELEPRDRAIIRELGLRFRGRGEWPMFRSYRPSEEPWFLDPWEVHFLDQILRQAVEVATRAKERPDLLEPPSDGLVFGRLPRRESANRTAWQDEWVEPEPWEPPSPPPLHIDEIRLHGLKTRATHTIGVWELGTFSVPGQLMDAERPYFSVAVLCVDASTGLIVFIHVADPRRWHEEVLEPLLHAVEEYSVLPAALVTMEPQVVELLAPPAAKLGVSVERIAHLPCFEAAKASLFGEIEDNPDWLDED